MDAENSFGANIRTDFLTVVYVRDGQAIFEKVVLDGQTILEAPEIARALAAHSKNKDPQEPTDADTSREAIEDATPIEKTPHREPVDLEQKAASKLRLAKLLIKREDSDSVKWLQEIISEFPDTKAAEEAASLLNSLPRR